MLKTRFQRLPLRDRLLLYSHVSASGCWLWQGTRFAITGYGQVTHNKRVFSAHRLSLHVFRKFNLNSKDLVLHHCDVKHCINPDHLYKGTAHDNMRDAKNRGQIRKGASHPMAKLNDDKVKRIRAMLMDEVPPKKIAEVFNVEVSTINLIKRRKIWTHVKGI